MRKLRGGDAEGINENYGALSVNTLHLLYNYAFIICVSL
jgi:hypothetical protein